jgi:DNA sulfur modification protein DndC
VLVEARRRDIGLGPDGEALILDDDLELPFDGE